MKSRLLVFLVLVGLASSCPAEVVNPAPDFSWAYSGTGKNSLRKLRGQPVVLLIDSTPKARKFRGQAKRLEELYEQFASRGVVFIAAFSEGAEVRIPSEIPFVVVGNGAEIAALYGVEKGFCIAVIGKDGNIDLQSAKVQPASKVHDVVINSFQVQKDNRD